MEFIDIHELDPKNYGVEKKEKNAIYGKPHRRPHSGCVKSKFKTNRKYRSFVRMELCHKSNVADYIMPTYYRKTWNWSDCGVWRHKIDC
jgi:hypothetical protein